MNANGEPNRLISEKSPYLLQHAYNPVNWYSWSEEAFQKAKEEDKPIFLSIGYSTCHWCHVMERESFEDEEVADVLNKYFIAIKVDREERPDIDSIYMNFCQAITGSGGWPLTIIMTPDKKLFYAGTYFPKHTVYGRVGLIELLNSIHESWNSKKEDVLKSSKDILEFVEKNMLSHVEEDIGAESVKRAFTEYNNSFDNIYGGFGTQPKFPTPHNLSFLLRHHIYAKSKISLEIVEKTLESMYKGGIFDHIGFGFARYSVDEKWLIPHFEKMLYDNALLAIVYTEAYLITKKEIYKEIVEKIFEFVIKDMTSKEGGFYSAIDADSEGVEGKFYVWGYEEVFDVLGDEKGKLFSEYYNIVPRGNFEGKNVPNLIGKDLEELNKNKDLKEEINNIIRKLYDYREKRVHPHKDDKILTSWNGLMIAALAYAGKVFKNKDYISMARRSVEFIFKNLVDDNGRLLARYRDGEAAYPGYLDDYAFLTWGLIELYEATFDTNYLEKALDINKEMLDLFWDNENGGLFIYGKDSEQLIVKHKEIYDGAIPSGNSVAALNLLRLYKLTGDNYLEEKAQKILKAFGGNVKVSPNNHGYFLMALLFNISSTKEIVISGHKDNEDTQKMLDKINQEFLPFSIVVLNDGSKEIHRLVPFTENQEMIDNKATAYVCENYSCNIPTSNIEELEKLIKFSS
ncbi:thioredoxin domain protein [Gottschalkia purinilytica]|uniref:Thioredoxin domain protein n=1 Tax=Gottschalkia purinilytica TaxID=1503 RepID=A0A0L0W7Y9_GOTPU|nr:thioredoxin domain-containing protein [Gottschalkia purinilytica]KNF07688.1 thioredoxin domain protein [Gottschalkia purinilytica]